MSRNIFRKQKLLFATIILIAAFFRFYGLNWDQNQHLHPDERFLTMVANAISWPKGVSEYLDAQQSSLNPANAGFNFFVYGTFPLFFAKALATISGLDDYTNFTLLGRAVSAIFDLGTVILVFLIAKALNTKYKILDTRYFPYLSAFFYAISVLPIQLSHFFAVDTFLTFFITLSFYLLIKMLNSTTNYNKLSRFTIYDFQFSIFLGIAFGLALASKISALLFFPIIILGILLQTLFLTSRSNLDKIKFLLFAFCSLLFFSYLTFRLANPYAFASPNFFDFSPNPNFINNLKELRSHTDPATTPPYGVQWTNTTPIIFPLINLVLWGLGLPLGILFTLAFAYVVYKTTKRQALLPMILGICWILFLILYQGSQFSKSMRYFLPLYPFAAILTAYFLASINFLSSPHRSVKTFFLLLAISLWPLSFVHIYTQPHSRVLASYWIYQNIPAGSYLVNEHWDDVLPLYLPNYSRNIYTTKQLPFYQKDTEAKWISILAELDRADYVVLTSSRLYDSIPRAPKRYPIGRRYYQSLFDGSLGLKPVYVQTSYPKTPLPWLDICLFINPPYKTPLKDDIVLSLSKNSACQNFSGIVINDDPSEEAFTVYDHPKVIIFAKTEQFSVNKAKDILLRK